MAVAVAASGVVLVLGGATQAAAAGDAPPFNQDGFRTNFELGCYFVSDPFGYPLWVDDPNDPSQSHEAELSNPDDLLYLKSHAPDFFDGSMQALADTRYPFPVSVELAVGTQEDARIPANPLPGVTYPGPVSAEILLVLPATVAHVIRDTAGLDGLTGEVLANAEMVSNGASGRFELPVVVDPFTLGTPAAPVVPVDEIAEIRLETFSAWRDIALPADWNEPSFDAVFDGNHSVMVGVGVVDQANPDQGGYYLNLSCFPNGGSGTAIVPLTLGTVRGNFQGVAPSFTSAAPGAGAVGTPYAHQISVTGTAPVTFAVTHGAIPAGLSLNQSTGELSGIPSQAGSFEFTVAATNEFGTAERVYAVVIAPAETTTVPPTQPKPREVSKVGGRLAATGGDASAGALLLGGVALCAGTGLMLRRALSRR